MADLNDLIKKAESLLADIESMRCPDVSNLTDSFAEGYGPFSEFVQDGDDSMFIEWPNLDISAADLRKAINDYKNTAIDKVVEADLAKAGIDTSKIRINGSEREQDWHEQPPGEREL